MRRRSCPRVHRVNSSARPCPPPSLRTPHAPTAHHRHHHPGRSASGSRNALLVSRAFRCSTRFTSRYKSRDDVVFITVNADPNTVSDQTVRETHKAWGSNLPLARDPNEHVQKAWQVSAMPAMFVVGADGTVQHHEMGVNGELEKELPETIELLLQGKSTVERAQKNYETRLAEFERIQQTPPEIPRPMDSRSRSRTTIAPRSNPLHHRLEKLWTATDLKLPGNILIVEPDSSGGGTPKIFAFDGWTTIVELQPDGTVAARHELELPQDAVVALIAYRRRSTRKTILRRLPLGTAAIPRVR